MGGPGPGLDDWREALRVDTAPLGALDEALAACTSQGPLLTGPLDPDTARRHGIAVSADLGRALSELRMVKDAWEIGQLREAVNRTVEGFAAVVREFPAAVRGGGERWLQGTFDRYARTYGNGPGYATIVGSGRNAATLHWVRCDGPVAEDAAVLLDMGVETRSYYTADVTRTFPASGRFTSAQRSVHDLVERAHRAGLDAVGLGGTGPTSTRRRWRWSRAASTTGGCYRSPWTRPSPPRASTTAAIWCAASATTSASTCTTAPAPTTPRTRAPAWLPAWCSRSSRACTSTPMTRPCPRSCAASGHASRTTFW